MSVEAMSHVMRHSPHKGVTYTILLCIADSVNDQNGFDFWMSAGNLANKARTQRTTATRALAELEKDGWLVRTEDAKKGRSVRYRFIFVDERPVVWDSRTSAHTAQPPVLSEHTPCAPSEHKPNKNPSSEPKQEDTLAYFDESWATFDEFWKAYPRKVDKGHGRKAWERAIKKVDPSALIQATVEYREWCEQTQTETRYIPYPGKWLNGEQWKDERTTDATPKTNTQGWFALVRKSAHNEGYGNDSELEEGALWT